MMMSSSLVYWPRAHQQRYWYCLLYFQFQPSFFISSVSNNTTIYNTFKGCWKSWYDIWMERVGRFTASPFSIPTLIIICWSWFCNNLYSFILSTNWTQGGNKNLDLPTHHHNRNSSMMSTLLTTDWLIDLIDNLLTAAAAAYILVVFWKQQEI